MKNPHTSAQALLQIALDLSASLPFEQLYQRLINAVSRVFPCDAAALMMLQDDYLLPVALHGLAPELIGRRFMPSEHPRLDSILRSRTPVRFAANAELPDPFDGQLAVDPQREIDVHACMGCSLYVEDTLVGVLTLDALQAGAFDEVDDMSVLTFSALAAATLRNARMVSDLRKAREQQQAIACDLIDEARQRGGELVGASAAMEQLRRDVQLVAGSDLFVLISGETGTGKELVARTLHAQSSRAQQPLVYVNCAALPIAMAESELFGHVKGAFTGAIADRKGKFELADHGTLFLDEVGELPLELQSTLLRAIQQGEIQRVGADLHLQVDVRIIAATNRDLADEVAKGRFRRDLYHRLQVFPVEVVPLREHLEDLPMLVGYFLTQARQKLAISQLSLHPAALQVLQQYDWPGNVRELEHLLMRAALKARRGGDSRVRIDVEHLDVSRSPSLHIESAVSDLASLPSLVPLSELGLRARVDDFQRALIQQTFTAEQQNWARTAAALKMDRGNLYRLAQRLGVIESEKG
jgi:anaerobic nitric oxide reductase transcription regulator